jgi:hypothetical protein
VENDVVSGAGIPSESLEIPIWCFSRLIYSSEDHEHVTADLDPAKVPATTYLRHWQMGESVANRLKDIFKQSQPQGRETSILQGSRFGSDFS